MGPIKNEASISSGYRAGVARIDLGKWSVRNMRRLYFPGVARTNFPKYPGIFGKLVRENARKEYYELVRENARKEYHDFVL